MKTLLTKSLKNSYTYTEYRVLVENLLADKKSTSKEDSEDLVNYSKLNHSRMKRLDKTIKLSDEIIEKVESITTPIQWIVLSEGWCGDAAQNLPIINKIAELNKNISFKIVLRDEHTDLMDSFLTNGGRSIPKLIQSNNDYSIIKSWGPRPTVATKMVTDFKSKNGSITPEFKKDLQLWYNKDKGLSMIDDLLSFLGL